MKGKLRFGHNEYNVWESDGLWMSKMVDSKSPFWCYQNTSKQELIEEMKNDNSFPLVWVVEID